MTDVRLNPDLHYKGTEDMLVELAEIGTVSVFSMPGHDHWQVQLDADVVKAPTLYEAVFKIYEHVNPSPEDDMSPNPLPEEV